MSTKNGKTVPAILVRAHGAEEGGKTNVQMSSELLINTSFIATEDSFLDQA